MAILVEIKQASKQYILRSNHGSKQANVVRSRRHAVSADVASLDRGYGHCQETVWEHGHEFTRVDAPSCHQGAIDDDEARIDPRK